MKTIFFSVAIVLLILGPREPGVLAADYSELDQLVTQGAQRIKEGKWKDAVVVLERALPIAERAYGPQSANVEASQGIISLTATVELAIHGGRESLAR